MQIFRDTAGLPDSVRGGTVTIGNFDGVHRGHQAVIGEAARVAARIGGPLAVVSFEPHPRRFFRPDEPAFQLTPMRSKLRWFQALGVEILQLINFNEEISRLSAEAFVDRLLIQGLDARHVVVGYDFVFGHGRRGDVAMLRGLADAGKFGFTAVDPVKADDGPVYSSTNIRAALAAGDPAGAAALLGRCWEIEGKVQTGDKRGRQIGFPTANLPIADYAEPALGVYAVWAGLESGDRTTWRMGIVNIGRRPTFDGEGVVIEAHIFDFAQDIYDRRLRVALAGFIRPERKFSGIEEIRARIADDCTVARSILEGIGADELLGPPDRASMAGAATARTP